MICVIPKGRCIGGLGNSFGLINALLHFVLVSKLNIEFTIPKNVCHNLGKMFGSSNHTRSFSKATPRASVQCDPTRFVAPSAYCGDQRLPWGVFGDLPPKANQGPNALWCNSLSFTTEGENGVLKGGKHGDRCFPEHLKLPQIKTLSQAAVSDGGECEMLLEVDLQHILWHYNVSVTRIPLQKLYYASFHKTYQSPKMNILIPQDRMNRGKIIVAAHVRVGSGGVASSRFSAVGSLRNETLRDPSVTAFREKWMNPSWIMFALHLLERVVDSRCMRVHIFTDITHTLRDKKADTVLEHPDVVPIIEAFPSMQFNGEGLMLFASVCVS
jgi:hypothetical protein